MNLSCLVRQLFLLLLVLPVHRAELLENGQRIRAAPAGDDLTVLEAGDRYAAGRYLSLRRLNAQVLSLVGTSQSVGDSNVAGSHHVLGRNAQVREGVAHVLEKLLKAL